MNARERRLAENEALFRDVNETIEVVASRYAGDSHRYQYLCECAQESCLERVELARDDYESVRAHPARFFVMAGHEYPALERVVADRGAWLVVEKYGEAAALVAERAASR